VVKELNFDDKLTDLTEDGGDVRCLLTRRLSCFSNEN